MNKVFRLGLPLLACLASCGTLTDSGTREEKIALVKLYQTQIEGENRIYEEGNHLSAMAGVASATEDSGRAFWDHYRNIHDDLGEKAARKILAQLVREEGVSVLLMTPLSTKRVDPAWVDQLLEDPAISKSKLLTGICGDPPKPDRVQGIRRLGYYGF